MKSSIADLLKILDDWSDGDFYLAIRSDYGEEHPTILGVFFDGFWTEYPDMALIKQYIDPKQIKSLRIACEKDNKTNYIPKEFISEFSNIEYLELSRLKFNWGQYILDKDIFENLKHLKTILFDRMTLQPLSPQLFQHSKKLEKIEFEDIHTYQIPVGFFHNLKKLKIIEFYGGPGQYVGTDYIGPFENLDPELLIDNTDLEIFKFAISYTAFPKVPENLFENCFQLKEVLLASYTKNEFCLGDINLEKNQDLKSVSIYGKLCEETRNHLNAIKERRPDVEIVIDGIEN